MIVLLVNDCTIVSFFAMNFKRAKGIKIESQSQFVILSMYFCHCSESVVNLSIFQSLFTVFGKQLTSRLHEE